jgi:hypothetical protein
MNMSKRQQKSTSPTNVNAFSLEGWMTRTRPIAIACTIPGRIGDIIGFNDYYFEVERVLCTRAFSTSAVGTTVDDGESPREAPNSTTKLATTAKCRTASTLSSAPAFLESPWTLGLSLDRKRRSKI